MNGLLGFEPWMEAAACATADPEAWFPEKSVMVTREVKRICGSCDVRERCLQYALDHDEWFGVWGGFSARDRHRIKRGEVLEFKAPVVKKQPARRCICGNVLEGHENSRYCSPECKKRVHRESQNTRRRARRRLSLPASGQVEERPEPDVFVHMFSSELGSFRDWLPPASGAV